MQNSSNKLDPNTIMLVSTALILSLPWHYQMIDWIRLNVPPNTLQVISGTGFTDQMTQPTVSKHWRNHTTTWHSSMSYTLLSHTTSASFGNHTTHHHQPKGSCMLYGIKVW